jgi:hypothetical protein
MAFSRTLLGATVGALLLVGSSWTPAAEAGGGSAEAKKSSEPRAEGQRPEGGGGRRGEGPGGRGNFDPEQFRQMMMDRMKETLGATDEEWKVLAPKLEKVMTAAREARAGGMGGMGGFGPGGRGGPGGGRGGAPGAADTANQTPLAKASADLRTTLDNKSATAAEIEKKLTAYRDARDKAQAALVKAQKELKELLTQRQEATLVMMGTLD